MRISNINQRIQWIDGLKGFGAICIFLCHFRFAHFFYPTEFFYKNIVTEFFMNGAFYNALFLILSGFSAYLSVSAKCNDTLKVNGMILNRYLRFAVPFAITLSILLIFRIMNFFYSTEAASISGVVGMAHQYEHYNIIGFIKALFLSPIGMHGGWNPPLWIMKYIFFSTFVALIFWFAIDGLKERSKLILSLLFGTILFYLDIYMYDVFLGIVLALIYKKVIFSTINVDASKRVVFTFLFFVFFLLANALLKCDKVVKNMISSYLFILAFYFGSIPKRIFETKVFGFLGKISFSMYMWHYPIICTLSSALYIYLPIHNYYIKSGVNFVLSTIVVIIISYFSYSLMEKKLCLLIINKIKEYID